MKTRVAIKLNNEAYNKGEIIFIICENDFTKDENIVSIKKEALFVKESDDKYWSFPISNVLFWNAITISEEELENARKNS